MRTDAAAASALETIAVVIPCRNEVRFIKEVLDGLRSQDLGPHEVVIVDGGSTDGTLEVLARYAESHPGFPMRVLRIQDANISSAMNQGIAVCQSDVIVRMDAHSRPAPDYIRQAVRALHETGAAVVGGIWHTHPGGAGRMAMAIARAVTHPLGAGDAAYRLARTEERQEVDTVPFGCFRRAHWGQLGGYSETLLVNEDYEFNYRTRLGGGAVILDPAIRCDYFARPTIAALARQYFRYGWWKGRMLQQHPWSIRWRQLVPAAFLPGWVVLAAAAGLIPAVRPLVAALFVLYVASLLVSGWQSAPGASALRVAAAFLTIHTSWSAGLASFAISRVRGAQLTLAVLVLVGLGVGIPSCVGATIWPRAIAVENGAAEPAFHASVD